MPDLLSSEVNTVREVIPEALAKLGPEAMPALMEVMRDGRPHVRKAAACELETLYARRGEEAPNALRGLCSP